MTTPRVHARVSLAIVLASALALGACAGRSTETAPGLPTPTEAAAPADRRPPAVRFTNEAGEHVHVYLVGARRQWLLGRVEAGARASLRIPEAALLEDQRWMRLAVLVGQRATGQAVDDPRAAITLAQSTGDMLAQRWTYTAKSATGLLTALPLARPRDGRPPMAAAERPVAPREE